MRDYVDLDAVVAFCRRLGMAVTWKMSDAANLERATITITWSG